VPVGEKRFLQLEPAAAATLACAADEDAWYLEEIRAGRPLITAATQDQFVPQMVNLETVGGVDFRKGCYPGQEIVARAQYRGQVKRRMVRLPAPQGARLLPGQAFNGGTVVDSAGGELLAVMPI
jgi:folate-binding protein YgfZ